MEGIETVETFFLKKFLYSNSLISSELSEIIINLKFQDTPTICIWMRVQLPGKATSIGNVGGTCIN